MTLKSKEEKIDEFRSIIDALKQQINTERVQNSQKHNQLRGNYQESEEQKERIELEAKDLENQVTQMQMMISQKDQEIEDLHKRAFKKEVVLSERSHMEQTRSNT